MLSRIEVLERVREINNDVWDDMFNNIIYNNKSSVEEINEKNVKLKFKMLGGNGKNKDRK